MNKSKYFLYNTVSNKVLGYFTEEEFTNHMRKIAVDNGDEGLSIQVFGEAKSYLNEYCENLEFYQTELTFLDILQVCESIKIEISDKMQHWIISNYFPHEGDLWFETVEQTIYSFESPNTDVTQLKIGRDVTRKFGDVKITIFRLMENKWELQNKTNGWFVSIVDGNTLRELLSDKKGLSDLTWY